MDGQVKYVRPLSDTTMTFYPPQAQGLNINNLRVAAMQHTSFSKRTPPILPTCLPPLLTFSHPFCLALCLCSLHCSRSASHVWCPTGEGGESTKYILTFVVITLILHTCYRQTVHDSQNYWINIISRKSYIRVCCLHALSNTRNVTHNRTQFENSHQYIDTMCKLPSWWDHVVVAVVANGDGGEVKMVQ